MKLASENKLLGPCSPIWLSWYQIIAFAFAVRDLTSSPQKFRVRIWVLLLKARREVCLWVSMMCGWQRTLFLKVLDAYIMLGGWSNWAGLLSVVLLISIYGPLVAVGTVSACVVALAQIAFRSYSRPLLEVLYQRCKGSCLDFVSVFNQFVLSFKLRKIKARWEIGCSAFRKMEKIRPRFTTVLNLMVLRTVLIFAILLIARVPPKVVWVVLQLFPPMTIAAIVSIYTSFFVIRNFFLRIPSSALLRAVSIQIRLAAEILPVMSVNTAFSIVVTLLIWAPHCFEMKTIEVCISYELLN